MIRSVRTKMGKRDLEEREGGRREEEGSEKNKLIMYMYPFPEVILKCMYCKHILVKTKRISKMSIKPESNMQLLQDDLDYLRV